MNKRIGILLLFALLMGTAPAVVAQVKFSKDLRKLTEWYAGRYENVSQVRRDSLAQPVLVYVTPIWENLVTDGIWMYEEITDLQKNVISQRIYRFADVNAFQWEAVIYELPGIERYVGAWQNPSAFDELDPEVDLNGLADCTIIFNKKGEAKYAGATIRKECKYGKKNAYYVTSAIEIYENKIIRADRGFEHDHTQLWGPVGEEKGWEMKKIDQKLVDAKEKAKSDAEAAKAKKRKAAEDKRAAAKAKAEAKKAK